MKKVLIIIQCSCCLLLAVNFAHAQNNSANMQKAGPPNVTGKTLDTKNTNEPVAPVATEKALAPTYNEKISPTMPPVVKINDDNQPQQAKPAEAKIMDTKNASVRKFEPKEIPAAQVTAPVYQKVPATTVQPVKPANTIVSQQQQQ